MEVIIDITLLSFLLVLAFAVMRLKDLFATVMLFGIYSLLAAAIFFNLDAPDVAFTEAAVGAGISTILMLATLSLTGTTESKSTHHPLLPSIVVVTTAILLIYGTFDFPTYGDPNAPIHQHVTPRYIEQSPQEIGIPNVVTSILASYRGFDTFGEVVVIFTAGLGVMLLLGFQSFRKKSKK